MTCSPIMATGNTAAIFEDVILKYSATNEIEWENDYGPYCTKDGRCREFMNIKRFDCNSSPPDENFQRSNDFLF